MEGWTGERMDGWRPAVTTPLDRLDKIPINLSLRFFFNQLDARFHFTKLHLKHDAQQACGYAGL